MDTESFELKVVAVVEETRDARSITLQVPAQIAGHFDYRPGQFLTLAIPSERTGVVARCYSLCSCPHDDEHLTIAVKRTADGYASNWIVDRLGVGDTVRVLPPLARSPRPTSTTTSSCSPGDRGSRRSSPSCVRHSARGGGP